MNLRSPGWHYPYYLPLLLSHNFKIRAVKPWSHTGPKFCSLLKPDVCPLTHSTQDNDEGPDTLFLELE